MQKLFFYRHPLTPLSDNFKIKHLDPATQSVANLCGKLATIAFPPLLQIVHIAQFVT